MLASVAAYDSALVSLTAGVANTYLNIRTLQQRIQVAQDNVKTQQESLRIARAQFENGETSELDVQQAQTQLAQTQSQIPGLENSLRAAEDSLAVLLGTTPDMVDAQLARRRIHPGRTCPGGNGHAQGSAAPPPRCARGRIHRGRAISGDRRRQVQPLPVLLSGRQLRLRRHIAARRLYRGPVQLGQPSGGGQRLLRVPDLQLRAHRQLRPGAGRGLSAGGPQLPEHRAAGTTGGRGRALGVRRRAVDARHPDRG